MELRYQGSTCLTVIGVYMSHYHQGSSAAYCEILDKMQGIIINTASPFMIVGDMNVALLQDIHLQKNWYKSRLYTNHSKLLYDMLGSNSFFSANFCFEQPMNYTYYKGEHR